MDQGEVKPDEEFEKFLAEKSQGLPEARRHSVALLARSSYYGEPAFAVLYPEQASSPPDIIAETPDGPTGPVSTVSLRYRAEDIEASEDIVDAFEVLSGREP